MFLSHKSPLNGHNEISMVQVSINTVYFNHITSNIRPKWPFLQILNPTKN